MSTVGSPQEIPSPGIQSDERVIKAKHDLKKAFDAWDAGTTVMPFPLGQIIGYIEGMFPEEMVDGAMGVLAANLVIDAEAKALRRKADAMAVAGAEEFELPDDQPAV